MKPSAALTIKKKHVVQLCVYEGFKGIRGMMLKARV